MSYASKEKCALGSGNIITFEIMFTSHSKAEKWPNLKSIEQFIVLRLIMYQSELLLKRIFNTMDSVLHFPLLLWLHYRFNHILFSLYTEESVAQSNLPDQWQSQEHNTVDFLLIRSSLNCALFP